MNFAMSDVCRDGIVLPVIVEIFQHISLAFLRNFQNTISKTIALIVLNLALKYNFVAVFSIPNSYPISQTFGLYCRSLLIFALPGSDVFYMLLFQVSLSKAKLVQQQLSHPKSNAILCRHENYSYPNSLSSESA